MRNTKQKDLILNIVSNSCNHPTAYDIYTDCKKEIPNISLGTVYRNLNALVELNKIQKIKMNNNIDRYDKIISHMHFICIKCCNIIDINQSFNYGDYIKQHKVLNCKIFLEGICKDCLGKEK